MSWDPAERYIRIKSKKDNQEKIINIIEKLDLNPKFFEYEICDDIDNNVYIDITDYGAYKYGFSSRNDYNFDQFIKDILDVDKENITINVSNDGWMEDDSDNYFYENGKLVIKSTKEMDISESNSKQEKIEKVKKDFSYFELLSKEERKDFDYQMASLEAPYPSYTWEYGSDDLDALYTDEFLDNEETVRAIFKFGGRKNLFKTRVPSKYKEDFKLMSELLLIRPNYIECLPDNIKENKDLILKLIEASKPKNKVKDNKEANVNNSISSLVLEDDIFNNDDFVSIPLEENLDEFEEDNNVENPIEMENIPPKLRNDKEIALKMIEIDPKNFDYVSSRLKKDYDVCYKYIYCGGCNLKNVNNLNILSDVSLMRKFIKKSNALDDENLKIIPNSVKEDKEFLINFFVRCNYKKKNSINLQEKFESMEIKDIIAYAITNVKYFDWYFAIVPKSLRCDKDIVEKIIEANKKEKWSRSIPIDFKTFNDKDIMKKLKEAKIQYYFEVDSDTTKEEIIYYIKNNQIDYKLIDKRFLDDADVKKTILKYYEYPLFILDFNNDYVPFFNFLKKITDFNESDLKLLFKNHGWLIKKFPKYLKDKDAMKIVLSDYPDAYKKMSNELKNDRELVNIFINKIDKKQFNWLPKKYQEDKETCLKIISSHSDIYYLLSDELKEDYDIAKIALKNLSNFTYAPADILNSKMLVKDALLKYDVLCYETSYVILGDKLRDDEEFILELCHFGKDKNRFKYMLASKRLLNDKNFISKVFNFDPNLTLEEMYIKVVDCYTPLKKDLKINEAIPIDMLNDVNILRHYLVKQKYINNDNDYRDCKTSAELICAVTKKGQGLLMNSIIF